MVSYKITTLAFAALATAIPHAHQHLHRHSDQSVKLAPLAGRAVSYDGSCGAWSGMTCPPGNCCGPNNWCGSGDAFCSAGCQAGFGLCGSGAGAPVAPAASSSTLAPITLVVATSSHISTASTDSVANKHGRKTRTVTTFLTKTLPIPTSAPPVPVPSSSEAAPTIASSTAVVATTPAAISPVSSPPPTSGPSSSSSTYIKTYKGDGSSGWPAESSWLSFENLWTINTPIMLASCMNAFSVPNNSEQELSELKAALTSVSASSGVDLAFAFAIMMQESNGCVRAPTTTYSITNPGLFQSHSGAGSCNNAADGGLQNPCPSSEISQMVSDGLTGTSTGDGLQQLIAKASGGGSQTYYKAARMYNSGSLDPSGDLGRGVATHCYVSDIANRLTGWSQGPSGCDAGSVGA